MSHGTVLLLGMPTFGLALAITTVSTYLPVLAREFTSSSVVIGLIVGGEGVMALFVPLLAGTWSDRLRSRIGGRLPFVVAGTPFVAATLALMGLVGSLLAVAALVAVFFAAYFVAYEPYRALYPDLVPDRLAGRAQSVQAIWRGAGTGAALVGGGLLFAVTRALPFIVASGVMLVTITTFLAIMVHRVGVVDADSAGTGSVRHAVGQLRILVSEHPALRSFLWANALWELSLAALKTFIVLFLTVGVGLTVSNSSLVIAGVAVIILIASPISGRLADRFGTLRVMQLGLSVYGVGLLVPFVTQDPWIAGPVLPAIAFGGAVIMTLPYAVLMPMMPAHAHGALTGYYSMSRGIGTMLGPLLAGVAIDALRGLLPGTHGYAAMWLVCSAAIGLSIPFLRHLRREERDRRALREG